jgi:type II secretory pathway component PulF
MPRYRARWVRRNGRRASAVLDAVDADSIREHIERRQRAFVVEVRRLPGGAGLPARTRVPSSQLLAALDSLELMLTSGVRVNAALRTIADSSPCGPSRRLWTEVALLLEENGGFCEALRNFPRVFNAPMLGVIGAHELAGRLGDGVRHARDYVAQMQEIRRESARAAAYPALIGAAGVVSSLVMCLYTLPRFSKMLGDIGVVHTNRVTGFFFGVSALVVGHTGAAVAAACAPAAIAWVALRPRFRPHVDRLALRLPLVRGAVEALCMSRICITYRALCESGVRVVEALDCCAAAAGNAVYSDGIRRVIQSVKENAPVGSGFEDAGVFAPEVVLAVKCGDGALPQVFGRLADYYRAESRHRVAVALRMIEPAMLVVVLAWVFGITLAVVLPVVEVVNEIH